MQKGKYDIRHVGENLSKSGAINIATILKNIDYSDRLEALHMTTLKKRTIRVHSFFNN